ncbi:MAG: HAD family hydrolase [Candidatus Cloacimonadaceae bacterium]|nr:HAD family hydrolase [Candidatus Cloacimonadaceae bacterium]
MTVKDIKSRRAIFLDRDGTISSDEYGYIANPDDYNLYSYTPEALHILQDMGFLLFIVTNQSGIARGYFGPETVEKVHERLRDLLLEHGVRLDAVYYSPYFKTGIVEPYNVEHEDRKPGIGMYKRAKNEFSFQTELSWMIGDRYTDIAFGHNAGMKTILLLSGNGRDEFINAMHNWQIRPDFVVSDLLTAAHLIRDYL